ncbi:MAG TPA: NAD(P)/FAD-dependent oxidoreductase [Solirubrobacteraceae bacterium]|nr:NAD(P)/FAD-dependent oxidoreductase [Solirubrobacteraceae bacterium]
MSSRARTPFDAVVVGAGHNGLVAATLLARAGRSVLVLERRQQVGGAAISGFPFPGVDARLSRYAYLVSLFPAALLRSLGVAVELRPRAIASYTPCGNSGLLVGAQATRASMTRVTGDPSAFAGWERLHAMIGGVADRLFATLTEPLRSRAEVRRLVGDDAVWNALFEEPLSAVIERTFSSDLVRGVVLTDATIGTFAPADDPELRQNRCFLYHVIGNGTGRWEVPVGGMGALTDALANAARGAGAEIAIGAEAVSLATDGVVAEVSLADGRRVAARHVLAGVAPAVLARLLGEAGAGVAPEGCQLKLNMVLARLPRLRDPDVDPHQAFAGTFHINEGYEQLARAYREAAGGQVPALAPCEAYCHSLTDASILAPELREAGVHALTMFALHMPARVFAGRERQAKEEAVAATLRSASSVLAEPLEDCLLRAPDGSPCLEAMTPGELEVQLAMPGGHIFHRDLAWPFAESEEEVGTWGVETPWPNVWLCGAGARRGGGVSGIPGHNAARAVLATG